MLPFTVCGGRRTLGRGKTSSFTRGSYLCQPTNSDRMRQLRALQAWPAACRTKPEVAPLTVATSGALTDWLKRLSGADYGTLLAEAEASGPGARGLLMLPYFAGERTPILDPEARGVIGLSGRRWSSFRAGLLKYCPLFHSSFENDRMPRSSLVQSMKPPWTV